MGDLTNNLSRSEFACECGCGFDTVDIELAPIIQGCADHFAAIELYDIRIAITAIELYDIRIAITGPNRCVTHNASVGGSANSQHIYARAVDFKLFHRANGMQVDPDRVADYLESKYPGKYGIGRYHNRTHFDNRTNGPARWDVRSK